MKASLIIQINNRDYYNLAAVKNNENDNDLIELTETEILQSVNVN